MGFSCGKKFIANEMKTYQTGPLLFGEVTGNGITNGFPDIVQRIAFRENGVSESLRLETSFR